MCPQLDSKCRVWYAVIRLQIPWLKISAIVTKRRTAVTNQSNWARKIRKNITLTKLITLTNNVSRNVAANCESTWNFRHFTGKEKLSEQKPLSRKANVPEVNKTGLTNEYLKHGKHPDTWTYQAGSVDHYEHDACHCEHGASAVPVIHYTQIHKLDFQVLTSWILHKAVTFSPTWAYTFLSYDFDKQFIKLSPAMDEYIPNQSPRTLNVAPPISSPTVIMDQMSWCFQMLSHPRSCCN